MKIEMLMENKAKGLTVLHAVFADGKETIVVNNLHLLAECLAADVASGDPESMMMALKLLALVKALKVTEFAEARGLYLMAQIAPQKLDELEQEWMKETIK